MGHSIAGALLGGIVAVEIFKWKMGFRESTGAPFVLPLALGIALGRLGCFFAGLDDFTFGVETSSILGIDFGDGLKRHPVQLYESLVMFCLFLFFLLWRENRNFSQKSFYYFSLFYASQRFIWEFLKPYPKVMGPFNLFHIACVLIILYSLFQLKRVHANSVA